MYLKCPSNESRTRTANAVFYTICLLFVFCAAAVVSDLISFTYQVSNKFICKDIILIISCAVVFHFTIASTSNWLTANNKSPGGCPSHIYCLLWLHLPKHHSTHKPILINLKLYRYIIRFIHLNLRRSTVVGSCGVKKFISWSFLHSWQSHSYIGFRVRKRSGTIRLYIVL